jgi:phosphatidylethanolamine/phosphatidyl-N-methylethanolamine N-methyltransferase
MDAQDLVFPDGRVDVVMAQSVVNTVPDPDATLDQFARVLRPGDEIILVKRVGAASGPRHAVERGLQPIVERLAMPPFGHFSLVRFTPIAPS